MSLGTLDMAAAQWVADTGQAAGRGTGTLTASDWQFQPLKTGERVLAVLGLVREDTGDPVRSDQLSLVGSLVDQTTLALERLRLEEEMRDVNAVRERDRLRFALLSSVSHDLRTPLTSVLAAVGASALRRSAASNHRDGGVAPEPLRLESFGHGPHRSGRPATEAGAGRSGGGGGRGRARCAQVAGGHAIDLQVSPDLPLVRVDPTLFHHCLLNLLDNAGRYANAGTPERRNAGTPVTVRARRTRGELVLSVEDEGQGLPPGRENEVFERFRRIEGSDRSFSGTGLGLAIVKGFAEAIEITVEAQSCRRARRIVRLARP